LVARIAEDIGIGLIFHDDKKDMVKPPETTLFVGMGRAGCQSRRGGNSDQRPFHEMLPLQVEFPQSASRLAPAHDTPVARGLHIYDSSRFAWSA
jgi:hypothetical protein